MAFPVESEAEQTAPPGAGWNGSLLLPPTADFHVHLRDGKMMELVAPTIRDGGVDLVYVMVGLYPHSPFTTTTLSTFQSGRISCSLR